jgi:hypothetical protein
MFDSPSELQTRASGARSSLAVVRTAHERPRVGLARVGQGVASGERRRASLPDVRQLHAGDVIGDGVAGRPGAFSKET